MEESLGEKPIASAENVEAEARLTPEQRLANKVRASIVAPLDRMNLPENEEKTIRTYAEKAVEIALSEFKRLKEESPAKRLVDALTDELSIVAGDQKQQELVRAAIRVVESQIKAWQDDVANAQGLAAIMGETNKPLEQIVVERIAVAKQQVKDKIPWNERRGIRPYIGVLITDWLKSGSSVIERMATAQTAERILKKLGFLPEGVSIKSLFALPESPFNKTSTESELEKLMWGGKPVKVSFNKVIGLQSEFMPGVAVQVEEFGGNRALVLFSFKPEAVTRSVAVIPAVTVT